MDGRDRRAASLLGALVADAASLGLHWIYDVGRIAEIEAREGRVAFIAPDAANFEGVPAYFAHGTRCDGQLTQYGEGLWLAMRHIHRRGAFEVAGFQEDFVAAFGPGGSYQGYIDKPTRGTLANIAAGQLAPSGIDDDQLPALARIPALVAAGGGDLRAAIEITNVNADALSYGRVFADLLARVVAGDAPGDAMVAAAEAAAPGPRSLLQAALGEAGDSVAFGDVTGRACHLPMGLPLAFHIMAASGSFAEAVAINIRAGGDSAGRAIVIGAVMGAHHGVGGAGGIPLDWVLRTGVAREAWPLCRALAGRGLAT